jgi:tetratricopeptide (TPR) repeat protein
VALAGEELSEDEQRAVAGRMLDYYLYCADLADGLLPITRGTVEISPEHPPAEIPVIDSAATAMSWLETERVNLLACSAYAVTHDWPVHAWQLPYTLSRLFWLLADKDSWLATHEAATPVVRRLKDPLAQFVTLHNLGVVLTLHERFDEALDAEREALSVSRRQGHGEWQARAYTSIANILQSTGRANEAEAQYLQAAEISKRTGAQFAEANNLHNLAVLYAGEQRHTEAVQQLRAALDIYRQLGDSVGETAGLSTLAESLIALGEATEALTTAKRSLDVAVDANSVYHQGIAHDRIAQALDFLGDQSALPHWQRSLSVLTDLGAPEADAVRARLARARVSISVRTPA